MKQERGNFTNNEINLIKEIIDSHLQIFKSKWNEHFNK